MAYLFNDIQIDIHIYGFTPQHFVQPVCQSDRTNTSLHQQNKLLLWYMIVPSCSPLLCCLFMLPTHSVCVFYLWWLVFVWLLLFIRDLKCIYCQQFYQLHIRRFRSDWVGKPIANFLAHGLQESVEETKDTYQIRPDSQILRQTP